MELQIIQNKIYEIRGQKVMLDFDLAGLYGVETRALNQAVKRNIIRFPGDFMFRLTPEEWDEMMRSQFVTASPQKDPDGAQYSDDQGNANWSQFVTGSDEIKARETQVPDNQSNNMRSQSVIASNTSQFVMTSPTRGKTYLPYAFTEHGVTMLASVLRSEKAVKMSIAVVRAFITLKQFVLRQNDMAAQLQQIRDRLGEHDTQLNSIYDAIENLLEEKADQKRWEERDRIGFKK